ncbi:MAG: hypothetical protein COA43_02070 [Robiginitomaculum sp.]|nr:MAG: hypothetical protein COA43_02070 [Robiginitomaculum sp.]
MLGQADIKAWAEFRTQNPVLYSPYFHFDYTRILSELCDDVFVLCITKNNMPLAFLPFQAKRNAKGKIGHARPIGAPMTDYHGFICPPDIQIDVHTCLRQAGIGMFRFSALVGAAQLNDVYIRETSPCTMMDISDGAQKWREGREPAYRRHLKSHRRRVRKSEEIGARKLVFNCKDQDVFDQLIAWKHQQFTDTGKYDVLGAGWPLALLEALWARNLNEPQTGTLCAQMHALYFGDKLAAVDFGIVDGQVFHSWMVGYDKTLQHLAPGIQLLEEMIDNAQALGYTRIDLGEGIDGYKRHYASEDIQVCSGHLAVSGLRAASSKTYASFEKFGEEKLGKLGAIAGKLRRRYTQISACEPRMSRRAKAMLEAFKGAPK